MFQFFRNFFKTKIGLAVALAFLGLIGFAFASSDVANTTTFGGVAGGDRVAVVGSEKIGTAELTRSMNDALDRIRQDNPTISMPAFLAQGGLDDVLALLVDRFAIKGYAAEYGLRAGENLVNSEIRQIPMFRGPDGNFSDETYRLALRQQGMSDAQIRDDLAVGLLAKQLMIPATFGATMPEKLAVRYAQLFKERRQGTIALLPSAAYAPTGVPTDAQLQAFYTANRSDFIRPERRVIRYATFNSDALGDAINPTEAEIAARYKQDSAQYAANEQRSFTQLIVPTQAAANSIRDRLAAGASIEQVAQEAGFRTSALADTDKKTLNERTSTAVADAYFAATSGGVTAPARSSLGWHVARVDNINRIAARTLDQVRDDITNIVREEKRAKGLADLASRIEEQLDDGATMNEVANELKLTVATTKPITGQGQVYGSATETAPAQLAPALATAFQMEEGEPEIAALDSGATYLLFEATDITPSAAAPLNEIRDMAVQAWRQSEGDKAAKAAADRVMARVAKGSTLAAAIAAEKKSLPGIEQINLTREDIARQREQRIPPPLALMFSMAQNTTKRLDAGNDMGWFVVDLDTITVGTIAKDDPLVAAAVRELGPALGQEYVAQMRGAMRDELGVERNQTAIDAVRKQLAGTN